MFPGYPSPGLVLYVPFVVCFLVCGFFFVGLFGVFLPCFSFFCLNQFLLASVKGREKSTMNLCFCGHFASRAEQSYAVAAS